MQYFTWDPAKAKANIKKHGVSFHTAVQAFSDPLAVREFDRIVDGEERWHTIGNVDGNLLILVVHTSIDEEYDEYIRIISARKAGHKEENIYLQENREAGYL